MKIITILFIAMVILNAIFLLGLNIGVGNYKMQHYGGSNDKGRKKDNHKLC